MKQILIMGMYGGGCSVVAGILDTLGIDMGDHKDLKHKVFENNTSWEIGDYEDDESIKVSEYLRSFCHICWFDSDKDSYLKIVDNREANERIKNYIEARNVKSVWGLKDQKMIPFLPLYLKHLTSPYIIFIRRNKEDIFRTLDKFGSSEDISFEGGKEKFFSNHKEMLDSWLKMAEKHNAQILEIHTDMDRENRVEAIAKFIGTPITQKAIDFYRDFI